MDSYAQKISNLIEEMDNAVFTEWEYEFIENMESLLERHGEDAVNSMLSWAQKEVIDRLEAKLWH